MKKARTMLRPLIALLLVAVLTLASGTSALAASGENVDVAVAYSKLAADVRGGRCAYVDQIAGSLIAPIEVASSAAPTVSLDCNYYVMVEGSVVYSPGYATTVATYRLSDAAKICRLVEYVGPAMNLQYGIDFYTKYNDVRTLDTIVFSGQVRSIWSRLSSTTRTRIRSRGLDAEHALRYIQRTSEYRKDPALKRETDIYLEQTLSGSNLRPQLIMCYPQFSSVINGWSIANLMDFAKCVVATPQYRALIRATYPISGMPHSVSAFRAHLSDEALAKCWEDLSASASYYWPDLVSMIEACKITLPVNLNYPDDEGGVGTSGNGTIPSVPVGLGPVEPKAYGH